MKAATCNRNGICFRFTHFLGEVDYEEAIAVALATVSAPVAGADPSGYDFGDHAIAP